MSDLHQKPGAQGFYHPDHMQPADSVGYLMRKVTSSIRMQADGQLACHDLTYAQWLPLYKMRLCENATLASMARDLETDPASMTRTLDRLEAKGLVRRERSTTDRRVVHLTLTDEGHLAIHYAQLAMAARHAAPEPGIEGAVLHSGRRQR